MNILPDHFSTSHSNIYTSSEILIIINNSYCTHRGPTSEKMGDVLQLGDVILPIATVFGEQRQVLQVLSACMGRVELGQLSEHDAPRLHLLGGVLDPRDGLPTAEGRFMVKTWDMDAN